MESRVREMTNGEAQGQGMGTGQSPVAMATPEEETFESKAEGV